MGDHCPCHTREMVDRQIAKHLQMYKATGAELIMGSGASPLKTRKLRRIVEDGATFGLALQGISASDVARGGGV